MRFEFSQGVALFSLVAGNGMHAMYLLLDMPHAAD